MSTNSLLAGNMVNICFRDAQPAFGFGPAACAFAAVLDGGEVLCEGAVAQVEHAEGGYGVAESLSYD